MPENTTANVGGQLDVELLRPYEDALLRANPGIDQMQARTMVYWAIATHCDFEPKPILLVLSSFGSGKTDLLTTLFPMANDGRWIQGSTYATIRNELHGCNAAFFDEQERLPESLLTKRFRATNSRMRVNVATDGGSYSERDLNINGWTAVAKRKPFADVALMSRSLVIAPRFVEGPDSRVTQNESLEGLVRTLGPIEQLAAEGRAAQLWRPLAAVCNRFGDQEWFQYAVNTFCSDMEEQGLTRQFEPDQAVLNALAICKNTNSTQRLCSNWVKLSDIKRTANTEYDASLKPQQVMAILHRNGYEVSTVHGYPAVKVNDPG